jgi:hypothetical protein
MAKFHRYVIGQDSDGASKVVDNRLSNAQHREGYYWRSTLWITQSYPPSADAHDISAEVAAREPGPSGVIFRALEIAPDDPDPIRHRSVMAEIHSAFSQSHMPSEADLERHPGMHRTATLDFVTCVSGSVFLVTDTEEVLMTPGDTAIIRGNNHAWSNRSDTPCMLTVVLVNAADH